MLTLTKNSNNDPSDLDNLKFKYIKYRKFIGRIVLPITRWIRAINAERYLRPGDRLLDIGCGDLYFLKRNRSKFRESIGIDLLLGDKIEKNIELPDSFCDAVTMLAVIEHLDYPQEILNEIRRVLKPNGQLIFTTNKNAAEKIINLYAKEIKIVHKQYFDLEAVKRMANGFRLIKYKTFEFGLNQVFYLEKDWQ